MDIATHEFSDPHNVLFFVAAFWNCGWGLGALLRWWPPSAMRAGSLSFYGQHRGCLNNNIFSNLGLRNAYWAHFLCHHEYWPTSASNPFSFFNTSLGLSGGKHCQKITVPILRFVLQNFAIPGYLPHIHFYRYIVSFLASHWVIVIAVCDSISVQGTS